MATIRPTGYLAHYGFSEEDVLEHYGVKGMKWGKHLKAKIAQLSDPYRSLPSAIAENVRTSDVGRAISRAAESAKDSVSRIANPMERREAQRSAELAKSYANKANIAAAQKRGADRTAKIAGANRNWDKQLTAGWASVNAEREYNSNKSMENSSKEFSKKMQSAYDKTWQGKTEKAYKNGKKKIKDLLKAADAGWNKSRARDTAIKAANKASDVVESVRNKDGTISFKKKKKR